MAPLAWLCADMVHGISYPGWRPGGHAQACQAGRTCRGSRARGSSPLLPRRVCGRNDGVAGRGGGQQPVDEHRVVHRDCRRHAARAGGGHRQPSTGIAQPSRTRRGGVGRLSVAAGLPPAIQLHLGGILNTVTATVTSGQPSVWAITMDGAWLHYDGATWTTGHIGGGRHLQLTVLASLALGANRVWAFGGTGSGPTFSPYAARHGPGGWTRTPVPGRGMIVSAQRCARPGHLGGARLRAVRQWRDLQVRCAGALAGRAVAPGQRPASRPVLPGVPDRS